MLNCHVEKLVNDGKLLLPNRNSTVPPFNVCVCETLWIIFISCILHRPVHFKINAFARRDTEIYEST